MFRYWTLLSFYYRFYKKSKLNDSYIKEVDDNQIFNENYGGFREDISFKMIILKLNMLILIVAFIFLFILEIITLKFFLLLIKWII